MENKCVSTTWEQIQEKIDFNDRLLNQKAEKVTENYLLLLSRVPKALFMCAQWIHVQIYIVICKIKFQLIRYQQQQ